MKKNNEKEVSTSYTHQPEEKSERSETYEMRRRIHNLRDRDQRTNNKSSGCLVAIIGIPVLVTGILSLIFSLFLLIPLLCLHICQEIKGILQI